MRTHQRAIQGWNPSALPAWLTRDTYVKRVVPALASVTKAQIRSALGVSEPYSSDIRAGKCIPHPRHWEALSKLAGVSAEGDKEHSGMPTPGGEGGKVDQVLTPLILRDLQRRIPVHPTI